MQRGKRCHFQRRISFFIGERIAQKFREFLALHFRSGKLSPKIFFTPTKIPLKSSFCHKNVTDIP